MSRFNTLEWGEAIYKYHINLQQMSKKQLYSELKIFEDELADINREICNQRNDNTNNLSLLYDERHNILYHINLIKLHL